jgi:hypothetical protein
MMLGTFSSQAGNIFSQGGNEEGGNPFNFTAIVFVSYLNFG